MTQHALTVGILCPLLLLSVFATAQAGEAERARPTIRVPWLIYRHFPADFLRWDEAATGFRGWESEVRELDLGRTCRVLMHFPATVTFDGGQFATFEAAWVYPDTSPYMPDSCMQVIGTKGTTQIDRQAEAIGAILEDKFNCPRTFLNYKVFDHSRRRGVGDHRGLTGTSGR